MLKASVQFTDATKWWITTYYKASFLYHCCYAFYMYLIHLTRPYGSRRLQNETMNMPLINIHNLTIFVSVKPFKVSHTLQKNWTKTCNLHTTTWIRIFSPQNRPGKMTISLHSKPNFPSTKQGFPVSFIL